MEDIFAIRQDIQDSSFISEFRKAYEGNGHIDEKKNQCRLIRYPFSCVSFSNILQLKQKKFNITTTAELIDKIESAARHLQFTRNRSDLFTFKQSIDIANLTDTKNTEFEILVELRQFLLQHVRPWLEQLTGAPLDPDKIDLTSSIYKTNDVLLCHDDELEGRRIAFILYLVPANWNAVKEGGCLELFDCFPESEQPVLSTSRSPPDQLDPWKVAVSLPPKRNTLTFFEVSAYSYHQVSEIIGGRDRVSIHGWFHGPSLPRSNSKGLLNKIPLIDPIHLEEDMIYRLMNPIYLDVKQQAQIRKLFVKESQIQLTNFLQTEAWNELVEAIRSMSADSWSICGPYNRRHFGTPKLDKLPSCVEDVRQLFRSEAMLVILSDLTGIQLHPLALQSEDAASQNDQKTDAVADTGIGRLSDPLIRRWTAGSYTLLSDSDMCASGWRLDAVLHVAGYGEPASTSRRAIKRAQKRTALGQPNPVSKPNWKFEWGGQLIYTAKDEDNELLRVHPSDNALSLVYIGPDTAGFVKYINHQMCNSTSKSNGDRPPAAYDLSVVYYESEEHANTDTQEQACSSNSH